MPTCQQSIQTKIDTNALDTISILTPSAAMPVFVTSTIKQLYSLNVSGQNTALFRVAFSLSVPTTVPLVLTITFYSFNDSNNTFSSLGSVVSNELFFEFQKDFAPGRYFLCIASANYILTGTITGFYSAFQVWASLYPVAYTGTEIEDIPLTGPRYERFCDEPMFMEIVEGGLPEGLEFLSTGIIQGILPNMDCLKENEKLSPSQNWSTKITDLSNDQYSEWHPWGREWRYKVKLWLANYPTVIEYQWFCLRVYNNWDWDMDNFNSEEPFEYEVKTPLKATNIIELPDQLCCEDNTKPPPGLIPIVPKDKCECEGETPTEQVISLNFLQWYQSVLKGPQDENNPFVTEFIENFKETDYFKKLMKDAGKESELYTEKELMLKAVEARIAQYTASLNLEGRRKEDIDNIMTVMKNEENQKLPTGGEVFIGQTASASLTKVDRIW